MKLASLSLVLLCFSIGCQSVRVYESFLGCFSDTVSDSFLTVDLKSDGSRKSNTSDTDSLEQVVRVCIDVCRTMGHSYASVKAGQSCACGSTCCHQRSDQCRCHQVLNMCEASLVYATRVKVPGRPEDLRLLSTQPTSLRVAWSKPLAAFELVSSYRLEVASLDKTLQRLKVNSESTTLLGLTPGQPYEVRVAAESAEGRIGDAAMGLFYTQIGSPLAPPAPQLVEREHASLEDGLIHVRLYPLDSNPFGPISGYRVVVLNETEPSIFDESMLTDWSNSQRLGLSYWIAAEIDSEWFESNDEFAVGDNKMYNGFLNHGPLDNTKFDFHITTGTISRSGNVTKVTYAEVGHEQHEVGNIIVLHYHKDNDHHHRDAEDEDHHDEGHHVEVRDQVYWLDLVLLLAIVLVAVLLLLLSLYYIVLRVGDARKFRYTNDLQELRVRAPVSSSNETMIAFDNEVANESFNYESIINDKTISGNNVEITNQVIGKGVFGPVIKATLIKEIQSVAVQHASQSSLRAAADLMLDRCLHLDHPHVLKWLGTISSSSSLILVTELMSSSSSMKTCLLDMRNAQRGVADPEQRVLKWLLGIATAMSYLERHRVRHEALCCRNVIIDAEDRAKVAGFSVLQMNFEQLRLDRWYNENKEPLWSFGILMWEATSMGATPFYNDFPDDQELRATPSHLRALTCPKGVSQQLYQVMKVCCSKEESKSNLDFGTIQSQLVPIVNNRSNTGLSFASRMDDQWDAYMAELEVLSEHEST